MQAEFARQIEIGSDLNAIDDGTGSIYYNSVSPWGEEFFLF